MAETVFPHDRRPFAAKHDHAALGSAARLSRRLLGLHQSDVPRVAPRRPLRTSLHLVPLDQKLRRVRPAERESIAMHSRPATYPSSSRPRQEDLKRETGRVARRLDGYRRATSHPEQLSISSAGLFGHPRTKPWWRESRRIRLRPSIRRPRRLRPAPGLRGDRVIDHPLPVPRGSESGLLER